MNKLEKLFIEKCNENMRVFNYQNFKKSYKELHKSIIEALNEVNNKPINNFNLMLIREDIKKATFKMDKPKVFIFGGIYIRDNSKVALLENVDTIGTYYLDDASLCTKLKSWKIGLRVSIEKVEGNNGGVGFNLVIGNGGVDIGLFD